MGRKGRTQHAKQTQPSRHYGRYIALGLAGSALLACGLSYFARTGTLSLPESTRPDSPRSTRQQTTRQSDNTPFLPLTSPAQRIDFASLAITYKDGRTGEAVANNAIMQSLLNVALVEYPKHPIPSQLGTPTRFEVTLKSVRDERSYLPSATDGFDVHETTLQSLLAYARQQLATVTDPYVFPHATLVIATPEDIAAPKIDFKKYLARTIPIYVLRKQSQLHTGTVTLRGTGPVAVNIDITQPQDDMGEIEKRGSIEYKSGADDSALYPSLLLGPITTTWTGNTTNSLDNILAEYFHACVAPRTVQHACNALARYINLRGLPGTSATPGGYKDLKEAWMECYAHYDHLEEALVHAVAHSITTGYFATLGQPAGPYGANYPGGKELGELCNTKGAAHVLREYDQRPDLLIRLAGLKHAIKY